jgi:uracil-DNA glycosylase
MSLKRKAGEAATDATKKPKVNGSITAFFGAPKPSPNSKTVAEAKFDREAWVAKLTDEQKDLLQLELDTLHESWLPHLKDVLLNPQFLNFKKFLQQELKSGKVVYPPMKDVYSWYASTTPPYISHGD